MTATLSYIDRFPVAPDDLAGQQIATEDQYGNFSTTVYDAAGNVVAQVDVYGNRTTFAYNTDGQPVSTEDQYGKFTTTVYDAYGRVSANINEFGNATTILYDAYGRVEATVDALGNRTTYGYDSYGEQVSTQTSLGFATTVYDSYGRVSEQIDQLGDITTTLYDSYGNVKATIDPLGNRTSFVYDGEGRPVATEDALGAFATTIYDSYGRVAATEDALGNFATTVYDSYGRVSATENAGGAFTTIIYDSYGRVAAVEDGLGHFSTTIYDTRGRVSATEDGLGNFTTTIYDSYGRVAATEDGLGNFTTTIYDSYGRVAATRNALASVTSTIYDSYGRPVATEDNLGNFTTTIYDSYGRPVATESALGHYTTMVLDSFGRQVNEIDSDGNVTTFVYDDLNRVVQEITPTGGSTTMAYDADGNLISQTDALGRVITYAYNGDGNNIGQTWLNADHSLANTLTFTYDANGNQLTAANNVGVYTMTYNATGDVSTVHGLWGTLLTFTYDANGNRTVVQDNFGGVTTNAYDADGNLTQQQFGGTGLTPMRIDQAYNADNELITATRYSDLTGSTTVAKSTYAYDGVGDLTSQTDKNGGGTAINLYSYAYDADGRVTSEQLNGGTPTTYGYDATSQLTNDGGTSESYDAEGNRTNVGDSTGTGNELESDGTWDYTYDAAGNETYKVAISGGETWEYGYDNKNELVKAQLWESDPRVYGTGDTLLEEVDYKYDAWGNLVERDLYPTGSGSPTVTRYAVDGWNPALAGSTGNANFNVWADLDGSNDLQTRYLHGDRLDELFARQDASVAYWYLTDYQGSVRDVLDNSGNVKDAIVYDGFGNIISETNSAYRGSYAWTGRMLDVETDLQYNRARWYDPTTGRWQSQDPLGFDAGDSNLYRYVGNGASLIDDPSGLQEAGQAGGPPAPKGFKFVPDPNNPGLERLVPIDPGLLQRIDPGAPAAPNRESDLLFRDQLAPFAKQFPGCPLFDRDALLAGRNAPAQQRPRPIPQPISPGERLQNSPRDWLWSVLDIGALAIFTYNRSAWLAPLTLLSPGLNNIKTLKLPEDCKAPGGSGFNWAGTVADGDYVSVSGCSPCVGVILVKPGYPTYAFHFNSNDDVAGTISKRLGAASLNGYTAYVCGAEKQSNNYDNNASALTLADTISSLKEQGVTSLNYVPAPGVAVDSKGTPYWIFPGKTENDFPKYQP